MFAVVYELQLLALFGIYLYILTALFYLASSKDIKTDIPLNMITAGHPTMDLAQPNSSLGQNGTRRWKLANHQPNSIHQN
jgi:hypothetical protein